MKYVSGTTVTKGGKEFTIPENYEFSEKLENDGKFTIHVVNVETGKDVDFRYEPLYSNWSQATAEKKAWEVMFSYIADNKEKFDKK